MGSVFSFFFYNDYNRNLNLIHVLWKLCNLKENVAELYKQIFHNSSWKKRGKRVEEIP